MHACMHACMRIEMCTYIYVSLRAKGSFETATCITMWGQPCGSCHFFSLVQRLQFGTSATFAHPPIFQPLNIRSFKSVRNAVLGLLQLITILRSGTSLSSTATITTTNSDESRIWSPLYRLGCCLFCLSISITHACEDSGIRMQPATPQISLLPALQVYSVAAVTFTRQSFPLLSQFRSFCKPEIPLTQLPITTLKLPWPLQKLVVPRCLNSIPVSGPSSSRLNCSFRFQGFGV